MRFTYTHTYKYFTNYHTAQEVKVRYRELIKQYHPDLHSANDFNKYNNIMAEINAEYDEIAAQGFQTYTNNSATSTDNQTTNDLGAFKNIINKVIFLEGVNISIVGTWVWIEGNTYPHRDTLRAAGFMWASKKKAWYWHSPEEIVIRHSNKMSLYEIKNLYGCKSVNTISKPQLYTV